MADITSDLRLNFTPQQIAAMFVLADIQWPESKDLHPRPEEIETQIRDLVAHMEANPDCSFMAVCGFALFRDEDFPMSYEVALLLGHADAPLGPNPDGINDDGDGDGEDLYA